MRFFYISFEYDIDLNNSTVDYVVSAGLQFDAINNLNGLFHEGYKCRTITEINECEYDRFKNKRMDEDVWRVTKGITSIVIELNRIANEKAGVIIRQGSYTVKSKINS